MSCIGRSPQESQWKLNRMVAPFQEQVGWKAFRGRACPVYIEGHPNLENGKLLITFHCFMQIAPGDRGRVLIGTRRLGPEVVPISRIAARLHDEWHRWKSEILEAVSSPSSTIIQEALRRALGNHAVEPQIVAENRSRDSLLPHVRAD